MDAMVRRPKMSWHCNRRWMDCRRILYRLLQNRQAFFRYSRSSFTQNVCSVAPRSNCNVGVCLRWSRQATRSQMQEVLEDVLTESILEHSFLATNDVESADRRRD